MELFSQINTRDYFNKRNNEMRGKIQSLSDDKILGADIEEWAIFYFDSYKMQPITTYLENASPTLDETKIEQANPYYERFDDELEPRTFKIDGYTITFRIPFDGDSQLFYLEPSTRVLTRFSFDAIKDADKNDLGQIIFSLQFLKRDMSNLAEDFVGKALADGFKNYQKMIDYVNNDANKYNAQLLTIIKAELETRKKKAEDFIKLGEILKIPLKLNPNAPSTTPIPLKKVVVQQPKMPTIRPREQEYGISQEDYDKIKQIVVLAGASMEKTARTFNKMDEEELRDIILSNLNTHFQGTATGETFSKVGKTDIHLPLNNKAAYIAECKIWHGEKQLHSALEQLFGYVTWRDVKTSIIIFNKDNKDFPKLLATIKSFLSKCTMCYESRTLQQNEWLCDFKKSKDDTACITVHIVAFDIFI